MGFPHGRVPYGTPPSPENLILSLFLFCFAFFSILLWHAMAGHGRPCRPWQAMAGHGRPWPAMAGHGRGCQALGYRFVRAPRPPRPHGPRGPHGAHGSLTRIHNLYLRPVGRRPWPAMQAMTGHGRPWAAIAGHGRPWPWATLHITRTYAAGYAVPAPSCLTGGNTGGGCGPKAVRAKWLYGGGRSKGSATITCLRRTIDVQGK
jgi:hypothetical protein